MEQTARHFTQAKETAPHLIHPTQPLFICYTLEKENTIFIPSSLSYMLIYLECSRILVFSLQIMLM